MGRAVLTVLVLTALCGVTVAYAYSRVALTSNTHVQVVPATPSYTEGVTPTITVMAPPSVGVVSIRWRRSDHRPAATAGHICVNDSQQGQFCANFAVGEIPADSLVRRIESLGLRVRSSG
jgi:hypothetical protein